MTNTAHHVATVAHTVVAAMTEAGITADELSTGIGTPRTTLDRKLAGATPFTIPDLTLIAAALEIPFGSLLIGFES